MLIHIKPGGASCPNAEMPDQMYITLLPEQILEIKD